MKKFSLLIVATIAMMGDAQGQIPHPNAAGQAFAYSMGPTPLKEGETLVHTANGCGYILSHFLSRQTFGDKTQVQIDQWGQNHVWTGECVSGLAIGPGVGFPRFSVHTVNV